LFAQGDYHAEFALTGNVSKNDLVIPVTGTGYAKGDMVIIGSDALFDSFNTQVRVAEIAIVRSSDATTVTLQAPLAWDYLTADAAYIQRLVPAENITITNGTVIGEPSEVGKNHSAFVVWGGRRIMADNVCFKNVKFAAVHYVDCIHSKVLGCSFEEASEADALTYGVATGNSSQDCLIAGNSFYDRRHAFTTTNTSAIGTARPGARGVSRRIKVDNNTIYRSANFDLAGTSTGDALDTHGAADDIEFTNNTIYGATGFGINHECRGGVITGNKIYGSRSFGIRCHNETDFPGTIVVKDNVIIDSAGTSIVVEEGFRGAGIGYTQIDISNNVVRNSGNVNGIFCVMDVAEEDRPNITVNGNNIFNGAADAITVSGANGLAMSGNSIVSGNEPITVSKSRNVAVTGNSVRTTSTAHRGILATNVVGGTISSNTVTLPAGTSSQGILVTVLGVAPSAGMMISGNACMALGANTGAGIVTANNATNSAIIGNIVASFNTPFTLGAAAGSIQANNVV
jgi:hypothetical protein